MRPNDSPGDAVLATLRELPTCDVRAARARQLRARCHRVLEMRDASSHVPRGGETRAWRAGGVVAGAWCVLYLFEVLRRAASVYGF